MKPPTLRTGCFLAVDVAILVICILYLPSLLRSARPPFEALSNEGRTQIVSIIDEGAAGGLAPGDRISQWNEQRVESASDLDFLGAYRVPGDTVAVTLDGGRRCLITCIGSYDRTYTLILLVVGSITWALGVFVLLARPNELTASALHWSLVCMGASTLLSWGRIAPGEFFPYVFKGAFILAYLGVPSLFLFFTLMFPRPRPWPLWLKGAAAFVPVGVLALILMATMFQAMRDHSLETFRVFQRWFDVFHVVLILDVAGGLLSILDSYRKAETRPDRKKIEWILWGLALGPTPFLFLVVLPELFNRGDIISEELSIVFFLLIPVSFAISFLKYHVLDIEVVIKRTTVYAIVLGVVIGLYALAVGTLSAIFGSFFPQSGAAAAIGVAVLFEPVRRRVQHWVDRRFFRVQYDFRQTGRKILEAVEAAVDESDLGRIVVSRLIDVIPVERIALFSAGAANEGMRILGERGWGGTSVTGADSFLRAGPAMRLPAAAEKAFEPGVPCGALPPGLPAELNVAAVFPIADENQNPLGCLALGARRSAARFTAEDVDLLMQVASESGLALQRIRLQGQLLVERITSQRLEELSRMKSDFVSYVSHELRTPLTSIKMFTEMLGSGNVRLSRKAKEYLGVIEGESERLSRMVTTILDSARIEQGGKEYRLAPGDLRAHVRTAMATMAYQLKQHRFDVRFHQPGKSLYVLADPDAVVQAVVNLVANAIKYSPARRELTVKLSRRNGCVICSVRDRGRGIPGNALPHLFERFYRVPDVRRDIQGVGLGLPLVHHIMAAHRGSVEVSSVPGRGTTFTLVFPALPGPRPAGARARKDQT